MPQPFDYTGGFIDPTQSMMQTLQMGNMLGQMGERRDARQATMAAAEQERIKAEQAAAEKAANEAKINEAFDKIHENPSVENYVNLANMLPKDQAKVVQDSWALLDKNQQQTALNDSANIFAAFHSGASDVGLSMLSERAEAAKNAGDMDSSKKYQSMIELANTGPVGLQVVEDMLGTNISMLPGGKEAIEGVVKFSEERRSEDAEPTVQIQRLRDIGKTEAEINKLMAETRKLDAETQNMAVELEEAKKSGGLDPEKKFASELSLNKEYTARAKAYEESLRLNDVIKTSAESGTGAGDLALINTFMKMLDPGSVVRESEFAQAQDTAGLLSKLAASAGRVQSGQVLVPAQREEFQKLADKYMQAAARNEEKVREGLNFMVKNYGLNPENVFGTMANEKESPSTTPPANIAAMRDYAKKKWKGEEGIIDGMDDATFLAKYKKTVAEYNQGTKPVEVDY